MKLLSSILLFLVVAGSLGAATENVLAITHVTIIDTASAKTKPDSTVIISNGRIIATGKSASVIPPANAVTLNARGKFLMPGLWDMHVHWYGKEYLPLFLANGVTGIRMMWGYPIHHEWRGEIEFGSLLGPRMFLASTLVDGPTPIWPGSFVARDEAEGRKAVQQARDDGADFVKVYSLLPREAYFAIADEAKKQGIPFEGHVPLSVSFAEASAAGQKSIEHLTEILPACSSREAELMQATREFLARRSTNDPPRALFTYVMHEYKAALETYNAAKAAKLFAQLKRNHTWQCPTFTVLHLITVAGNSSMTNDARLKYMPPELRQEWSGIGRSGSKTRSPEEAAFGKKYFQKHLEIIGAMQHAGVGILAGTDTGNPYCMPGFSLHDELGFLVQAGLTPMQALQAATIHPARFMGREKDLGSVATGKLADLVLLDANPLDDIANTKKISAVVYGGKFFSRTALDEMLLKVESLADRTESTLPQNGHETKTGFHLD